jgi:hypothetical protein
MEINTCKFYCPHCEYSTDKKTRYEKHMLTKKHHINANNILVNFCNECKLQFYDRSNYLRHLNNIHKVDISQLKHKGYYLIELKHPLRTRQGLKSNYLLND